MTRGAYVPRLSSFRPSRHAPLKDLRRHGQTGFDQDSPQLTADTGFFYVTKKNARTMTEKMVVKKYDPVVRKHVEFKEGKIK